MVNLLNANESLPKQGQNLNFNVLKHSFVNKLGRPNTSNGSLSSGTTESIESSPIQHTKSHKVLNCFDINNPPFDEGQRNGKCRRSILFRRASDRYVRQFPIISPERVQVRSFTSLTPLPVTDEYGEVLCHDCVMKIYGIEDKSDVDKSSSLDALVDRALKSVKEGRKMRLKDKLAGVSKSRFLDTLKGDYEMYDDNYDINKLIKHEKPILERQSTFSQLERIKFAQQRNKTQKRFQKQNMATIGLPNRHIDGHVSVPVVGVNWSFPSPSSRSKDWDDLTTTETRQSNSRSDSGHLYRCSFPVTDALHKEGTSVTMAMGRALTPGEVDIYKVWPRRLDDRILLSLDPVLIAKHDTPCTMI